MNKVLAPILEITIKESLANYESKEDGNSLEGLYLNHDTEDNVLVIYDDANHVINKVKLPDGQFLNLAHTLRHVLHQVWKDKLFERNFIVKPFTVNLVDKDFAVLEELFFLDEDTKKINDSIWTNIEKDLDNFLDNLLQ